MSQGGRMFRPMHPRESMPPPSPKRSPRPQRTLAVRDRYADNPVHAIVVCKSIAGIFCSANVRQHWGGFSVSDSVPNDCGDFMYDLLEHIMHTPFDLVLTPDFVQLYSDRARGLRIPRCESVFTVQQLAFFNVMERYAHKMFSSCPRTSNRGRKATGFRFEQMLWAVFPRRALAFALVCDALLVAKKSGRLFALCVEILRALELLSHRHSSTSAFWAHVAQFVRSQVTGCAQLPALPMFSDFRMENTEGITDEREDVA